ncbi:hypothetical protein F3Y22_tig00111210pilonHSYRG00098 [Hibiscus syriacus]|uniref:FCP1 homology domain-containing protein n=1 Tax=Hibiscus syriacus TaxID=106335 RepID=A0A6A2YUY7_HIBSY|nr:hypothetical protein F3Y22_tig00111210pilonHSYRG00098 [Hibiscus syriacus]
MLFIKKAGYDFVEKVGWKRVNDVGLDQEMEEIDPIIHEDDQPIGDAMMEEASEAPVGEDVTIKIMMEYMVNFREHIDSLVSGMRADISLLRDEVSMLRDKLHVDNQEVNEDEDNDEDDDDDYDDPRKYIVSAMPPTRKLDQANFKTYDNVTYCKDLNDVWNAFPHFNNLNTLLVDDSPEKMIYNPKYNYICPHSFDATSHSSENALGA